MTTQTQPIVFTKAVRKAVPLLFGLVGPSGCGKTYSALRLATGMQRVIGGRIKFIDTESKRALQYADIFDFDHFSFDAPYSSLRYLEVLRAAAETPGPIIVDSMSHEHEGDGGYIDLHDHEVQRLLGCGFPNQFAAQVPAWSLPAKNRGKLIQGITTTGMNAIFCFRAKEKVSMDRKDDRGKTQVDNLGWMPIAGDAFVYEMTARAILLPDMPKGTPQWNPKFPGEVSTCKLPGFFREYLEDPKNPKQLTEEIGELLAKWAAGESKPAVKTPQGREEILAAIANSQSAADLKLVWYSTVRPQWKSMSKAEQADIQTAWKDRGAVVSSPNYKPQERQPPQDDGDPQLDNFR